MRKSQRAQRAIEYVLRYETQPGCVPLDVSAIRGTEKQKHRGYDVKSGSKMIEVKAVAESWDTYTWQRLHKTCVDCLHRDPDNFFLYIVRFKDQLSEEIVALYIIPGAELLSKFRIEVEDYRLTPISQKALARFSQSLPVC